MNGFTESPLYFGVEIGGTKLQAIIATGEGRVLRQVQAKISRERGAEVPSPPRAGVAGPALRF